MIYCKSELITWSNTFSCGIRIIDEQHMGLVELVNEMFSHVTGDQQEEADYFKRVFQEAARYIKVHFATEEKIMLLTNYKGYNEHKVAHESFIATVTGYILDFKAGKRFSLYSFTKFLKNWVLSHIAVMDKQYFQYLRRTATRKENGRLSISSADIRKAM
ncbi:MAG: bacteriohemerythrin [Treponema sp.]|nr:bacteriohemerythrin [Treponema sp.]